MLDPQNDFEELLLSKVVELSIELDRVGRARWEKMVERIERAPEDELQSVHELGCRLFFDRMGPRTTYALWKGKFLECQTSWSGKAVDPDDPAMLVQKLEESGAGCRWLREQWSSLRERISADLGWQATDRFRAVRLLSHQPLDGAECREIAEMYLACFAIHPVGHNAWVDMRCEMSDPEWKRYLKRLRSRWTDLLRADEYERAKKYLFDLVDENISRLDAKIAAFDGQDPRARGADDELAGV